MSFFSKLRQAAEQVSVANANLLAQKERGVHGDLAYRASGLQDKERVQAVGAALGVSGIVGVFGVALANQAAELGGSTVLIKAANALAELGTVAVQGSALPVDLVTAVGAGVVGVVVLGVSKAMRSDFGKGLNFERAVHAGNTGAIEAFARTHVSFGSWLQGAANTVLDAVHKGFAQNPLTNPVPQLKSDNRSPEMGM